MGDSEHREWLLQEKERLEKQRKKHPELKNTTKMKEEEEEESTIKEDPLSLELDEDEE